MTTDRCGSHLGYRDHKGDGTPTCKPCRAAQAAWNQEYIKRRVLAGGQYVDRKHFDGGHLLIDGTGTRRRMQALAVMGWSSRVLARRLGVVRSWASQLMYQEQVRRDTAEKVAALYDELSMVPGPAPRASLEAKRKGWVGPLAWNDDPGPACIDDPAARPQHNARGHDIGKPRDLDREEQVMSLTRAGLSAKEIALRLRMHQRQVVRIRTRYREEGVAS